MGFAALLLAACGQGASAPEQAAQGARNTVKVTGELQSTNAHYFGPPAIPDIWSYTISFLAPDGTVAAAGSPILKFDTQELMTKLRDKGNELNEKQKQLEKTRIVAREQLAELRLNTEEAKADLDKARLKADIPEALLASRDYKENQLVLKQSELSFALRKEELIKEEIIQATEVEILEREVGVLKAEVDRLKGSIKSMTVMAPGEGVVVHGRDHRNNKVSVGDNVWMGRRVLEFPDLTRLQAHIEIPEREAARIHEGQVVRFTLDAAPDREFLGEIVELASVIHTRSVNQPDKVFDATVLLSNPDVELMRPGMSINAEILVSDAGAVTPEAEGP
jgi:multidrug efflux pump subunit AcrA (membrane-fusion protein)